MTKTETIIDKIKIMTIKFDGYKNARPGGGLFLGVRIHFPCTLCEDNNPHYTWSNITINIGIIIYTINIRINYAQKYVNFN